MADYDFSTLNSSDLEKLSCDLMNLCQAENSFITYKTFKDGKDKGIDFLYSSAKNDYDHVGQVKHYYRSGYNVLFDLLKKEEVEKIKKLKPNKYIFFTSVDLSVSQTENIKKIFTPYIKTLNDIYGKSDINKLITKYPQVLEVHFKLWLNDFNILQKILKSDLDFRSVHFVENELKKRIRLYVSTPTINSTKEKLKENNILIVTGGPGVGKTTLAEIISYDYITRDYKLSYVYEAREVESVLINDDSKQIIYFDDFLGSNVEEINKSRGSESSLIKILKRIKESKNKILILTTRTFLLKTAIEETQRLKRYGILDQCINIELTEYNLSIRLQILKNHVEESEMSQDYKKILNRNDIRDFIVNHRNFNPRSIEFITSKQIVNKIFIDKFENFIKDNFDYPDEIWKYAYLYQIKSNDQLLLNTLFSFRISPTKAQLERAFINRLNYEIRTNNISKEIDAFGRSLRRLNEGLIIIKNEKIQFVNPSLKDFLIRFLDQDRDELNRIVNSICDISQFSEQLFEKSGFVANIEHDLQEKIINNYQSFIAEEEYDDEDLIRLAIVIKKYIKSKKGNNIVSQIIDSVEDWSALRNDYQLNNQFMKFIDLIQYDSHLMGKVENSLSIIITETVLGIYNIEECIKSLRSFKDAFNIEFRNANYYEIKGHLETLFQDLIFDEVEWLKQFIYDESDAGHKQKEIQELEYEIKYLGIDLVVDFSEFKIDWWDRAQANNIQRLMDNDD